jgi:hypothetical protein
MYFDRFDIVSAHYAFCADYHSGQYSELYAKLSRISNYFRPGMAWNGYESLTENGQVIYKNLVNSLEFGAEFWEDYLAH